MLTGLSGVLFREPPEFIKDLRLRGLLFIVVLYVECGILKHEELVGLKVTDASVLFKDNSKYVVRPSTSISDIHNPAVAYWCLDWYRVLKLV